jgi:hypothetical protein
LDLLIVVVLSRRKHGFKSRRGRQIFQQVAKAVGASTPSPDDLRYFCEHGHYQNNPDPFVIFHGAHGYMIQFLGVTEREAIHKEYKGMLDQLCSIKKAWCLPQ